METANVCVWVWERDLHVFLCEGRGNYSLCCSMLLIFVYERLKFSKRHWDLRNLLCYCVSGWLNLLRFLLFSLWESLSRDVCFSLEIILKAKSGFAIYLFIFAKRFSVYFMQKHFNWSFGRSRRGQRRKYLMHHIILSGFASKEEATLLRFMYLNAVYAHGAAVFYLPAAAGGCKEMPWSMVWTGSG